MTSCCFAKTVDPAVASQTVHLRRGRSARRSTHMASQRYMILSGLIPLAVNLPPTLPDSIALHGQDWLLDCLDLLCSGGLAHASHEVITNDF